MSGASHSILRRLTACALGVFLGGGAHADTWVVDDDGPANFRDLPAAVAAARDGDTLLVRAGRYQPVALERKGLRIVGAGPRLVTIARSSGEGPFFRARDLSAEQEVLLCGVTGVGRGETILIERSSGLVLLHDLVVESRHPARGTVGPVLDRCANAVLSRVAVLPGDASAGGTGHGLSLARGNYALTQVVAVGAPGSTAHSPRGHGGPGSVGLAIDGATVVLAHCEFVGGSGGPALWDPYAPFCPEAAVGGSGGPGCFAAGKLALLAAGDGEQAFRGGSGGAAQRNPWDRCWSFAGDGGVALRIRPETGPQDVQLSGVRVEPGPAGEGEATRAGRAGAGIDGAADVVTFIEADARLPTLTVDRPAVCGVPLSVRLQGPPGARASIVVSTELGRAKLKRRRGFPLQAVPGGFWSIVPAGRFDEHGELLVTAPLPLDASFVGRTLVLQALVAATVDGERVSYLTNADVVTFTDG